MRAGYHGSTEASGPPDVEGKDLPFDQLAHYLVTGRIGCGGMGDVYLGYDPTLERKVALKVLPAAFARDPGFAKRFRHEAASAARLSHPNIVSVYFAGEDSGHLFFAMQYVAGESLADLLNRRSSLSVDESVEIIQQALAGLAHAHAQGMVHRDIKPANLLIDHRLQRILLADFGLVKSLRGVNSLTVTGTVMGTAGYISPEQGLGKEVDHRSDLYSLGAIMFQLLSGRLPFIGDSPSSVIFQHVYEPLPALSTIAPSVPARLSKIVERLLAKAPDERFSSAEEVLGELSEFRTDRSRSALLPDPSMRLDDRPRPADAIQGAPQSDVLAALTRSKSILIEAPRFPATPALPPDLNMHLAANRWKRLWQRTRSAFGRAAPQLLQQLQNTQQQIDGAVDEYERRRNILHHHLAEAKSAVQELQTQLAVWQQAAVDADKRRSLARNVNDEMAIEQECERCQQTVQALQREIALQENELDDMQLGFSQVNAKLEQLRGQRDLLNARLQIAKAQAVVLGGRVAAKPQRGKLSLVYNLACLSLVCWAAWFVIVTVWPDGLKWESTPTAVLPQPTRPGDEGRFPAEFLLGKEVELNFDATFTTFDPKPNLGPLRFASGGADGTIRKGSVNTVNGKVNWSNELLGHRHPVTAITFGPGSHWIASGDAMGEIRVWNDLATRGNELSRVLIGHAAGRLGRGIVGLKFNHDSTQLLSYGGDETIRLWDVLRERELRMVQHAQSVTPFAIADGGKKIITSKGLLGADGFGSWDWNGMGPSLWFSSTQLISENHNFNRIISKEDASAIRWWDPVDGSRFWHAGSRIKMLALSGDRRIALAATTSSAASVWDLSGDGTEQQLGGSTSPFTSLAITNDGRYGLTTTADRGIQVWRLPELAAPAGELAAWDLQERVNVVCFEREGTTVVIGGRTGIKRLRLEGGPSQSPSDSISVGQPVTALRPTRDGRGIAYASGLPRSQGNVVGLYHDGRWRGGVPDDPRSQFPGHPDTVTGVALLEGESLLLSGGRDARLRVWSIVTESEIAAIDTGTAINAIAVSPDERQVLVASDDELLHLYDIKSQKEIGRLAGHSQPVLDVFWPAKGNYFISASADHTMRVWDSKTLQTSHVLRGHEDRVNSVAMLDFGMLAVSGSDDGTVRVWDVSTEKEISIFRGHIGPVISVAVNLFGTRAASLGSDQICRIWDIENMPN